MPIQILKCIFGDADVPESAVEDVGQELVDCYMEVRSDDSGSSFGNAAYFRAETILNRLRTSDGDK